MQTIIVTIIISAALIYVGLMIYTKIKTFSPKKSCGSDCGCAAKSKN